MRLLPRAGNPTMTTHIRVSSAWTPTPLVFLFGFTKSPVGTARMFGANTRPLRSDMVCKDEPRPEMQECAQNEGRFIQEVGKEYSSEHDQGCSKRENEMLEPKSITYGRQKRTESFKGGQLRLLNAGTAVQRPRAEVAKLRSCEAVDPARLLRSEGRWSFEDDSSPHLDPRRWIKVLDSRGMSC
jgi:hypothetical protein